LTVDDAMPELPSTEASAAAASATGTTGRTDGARTADHAAIGRLADELLPALIAKLGATGLGELEVREGDWKVRLRAPHDGFPGSARHAAVTRSRPGHGGHGHAPAALEGSRSGSGGSGAGYSGNGSQPAPLNPVGPGRRDDGTGRRADDERRVVATSPAVGIYQPRNDASAGTRVRAGERLGVVDMLGVPHDVVAPADGLIGASLAEAGQAVEYGQGLVLVELLGGAPAGESRGAPGVA
jgi:biotin carboxyl carrier protein